jgi:hypothetical protein
MPEYSLSWILPFARAALGTRGDFMFSSFVNAMWNEMENAGHAVTKRGQFDHTNPNSQFNHNAEPEELKRSAVEAWSYMLHRGFLVPRHDGNFPSAVLHDMNYVRTTKGEKWSRGIEPLPEDPTGYMKSVGKLVSPLDSVIEQYLSEGVSSFEDEHYFAAAVMVGAASEKCLYRVADAMFAAVINPKSLLAELRTADGNPDAGPILRSPLGRPLNLDNLAKRTVRPILEVAGLKWHGWYALRRGIATLVSSVEKDAMAAKGLLRHASVTTTQRHYIKEVPEITQKAMEKVETLCTNRATTQALGPH